MNIHDIYSDESVVFHCYIMNIHESVLLFIILYYLSLIIQNFISQ